MTKSVHAGCGISDFVQNSAKSSPCLQFAPAGEAVPDFAQLVGPLDLFRNKRIAMARAALAADRLANEFVLRVTQQDMIVSHQLFGEKNVGRLGLAWGGREGGYGVPNRTGSSRVPEQRWGSRYPATGVDGRGRQPSNYSEGTHRSLHGSRADCCGDQRVSKFIRSLLLKSGGEL